MKAPSQYPHGLCLERLKRILRHGLFAAVVSTSLLLVSQPAQAHRIAIIADGHTSFIQTSAETAEAALADAGIVLQPNDKFSMTTAQVTDHTLITVYRSVPVKLVKDGEVKAYVTSEPNVGDFLRSIGYTHEQYRFDTPADRAIKRDMTIEITSKNAAIVKEEGDAMQLMETHFAIGRERVIGDNCLETSRGVVRYDAHYVMEATAYLPSDGDGAGITATGIPARYGVAAVDPDVIPLGSRLYIPGYGFALAADTGGAIVGDIIDLCYENLDDALEFGRRDVEVYVLSEG